MHGGAQIAHGIGGVPRFQRRLTAHEPSLSENRFPIAIPAHEKGGGRKRGDSKRDQSGNKEQLPAPRLLPRTGRAILSFLLERLAAARAPGIGRQVQLTEFRQQSWPTAMTSVARAWRLRQRCRPHSAFAITQCSASAPDVFLP